MDLLGIMKKTISELSVATKRYISQAEMLSRVMQKTSSKHSLTCADYGDMMNGEVRTTKEIKLLNYILTTVPHITWEYAHYVANYVMTTKFPKHQTARVAIALNQLTTGDLANGDDYFTLEIPDYARS
jgi:hypothetical protein